MEHKNTPKVGEFVRKLMPEKSTEEELCAAQQNVDELMEVLMRIYHRLDADGKLGDRENRMERY